MIKDSLQIGFKLLNHDPGTILKFKNHEFLGVADYVQLLSHRIPQDSCQLTLALGIYIYILGQVDSAFWSRQAWLLKHLMVLFFPGLVTTNVLVNKCEERLEYRIMFF